VKSGTRPSITELILIPPASDCVPSASWRPIERATADYELDDSRDPIRFDTVHLDPQQRGLPHEAKPRYIPQVRHNRTPVILAPRNHHVQGTKRIGKNPSPRIDHQRNWELDCSPHSSSDTWKQGRRISLGSASKAHSHFPPGRSPYSRRHDHSDQHRNSHHTQQSRISPPDDSSTHACRECASRSYFASPCPYGAASAQRDSRVRCGLEPGT